MFEALSDRFDGIFKRLRGKGKLREEDVEEVLREIRVALLEADVDFTVVRTMQSRIRERAVGLELSEALNPAQHVIKIVHDELIAALGGEALKITFASRPPTVVLMAGLQGSGKTTNSAKLARWFKQQGRNPILVGADLQRPAAVEQLRTLGRQIDVPVFSQPGDPVETAAAGLAEARRLGRDVLIVDTAGRLAIDAELMEQVRQISEAVTPDYTFLVVDAMTGQDAVNVAKSFNETLALDGVILTKLDGDARGGAALEREGGGRQADRLRVDGREARRLRAVPPRPPRRPHPRHGRRPHAHREGRGGLRAGGGRGGRGPAVRGPLHPRRLPRADAADQEDGAAVGPRRDDPGHAQGAEGRPDRGRAARPTSRRSSAR